MVAACTRWAARNFGSGQTYANMTTSRSSLEERDSPLEGFVPSIVRDEDIYLLS